MKKLNMEKSNNWTLTLVLLELAVLVIPLFLLSGCGAYYSSDSISTANWENIYIMESVDGMFSGELTIIEDSRGFVSISSNGDFITSNLNGSFGLMPRISASNLREYYSGYLSYTKDVDYKTNHDLEYTARGANILGKKYTLFEFILSGNGKLNLKITIFDKDSRYSGSINSVLRVVEYVSK